MYARTIGFSLSPDYLYVFLGRETRGGSQQAGVDGLALLQRQKLLLQRLLNRVQKLHNSQRDIRLDGF